MKASKLATLVWLVASTAWAQDSTPSISDKTAGMEHLEGFFDIYWDDATGKLYWEIDKLDTEFLYAVSLSSGLGSNPVGLDRGQLHGQDLAARWQILRQRQRGHAAEGAELQDPLGSGEAREAAQRVSALRAG